MDRAGLLFLERGVSGASMSEIAKSVACSKGTLYNYFRDKQELVAAWAARESAWLVEQMQTTDRMDHELRATLKNMGSHYLRVVTSEDFVRKLRTVVAEAERAPQIAHAFFEAGFDIMVSNVAFHFEKAMAGGLLRPDDSTSAARHFLSLCDATQGSARLCNVVSPPSTEDIEYDVTTAVEIVLLAYAQPMG